MNTRMKSSLTDLSNAGSAAHALASAAGAHLPAQDSISATHLFQGRQEIQIVHHGETYRLRITRNGKLILTK